MKKILLGIILGFVFVYPLLSFALTDRVVAVVNDEVITQSELDSFLKVLSVESASKYKNKKDLDIEIEKLKVDILNRLIEDKLIQQEARKQNIQIKKDAVKARIEQLKTEFYSDEAFYESLQKQGLTIGDIEKKIQEQLTAYQLIDREVKQKTQVKPTEVTAFYEGHKEEFKDPEKRIVDSIFVKTKEEAGRIIMFLNNGEDFLKLQEKYSLRVSIGEVVKGQLRKDIEAPIFTLKENEYSDIVNTEDGFYIFKLEKVIPERIKELSEIQELTYNFLLEKRMQERMGQWLDELKAKAHIVIK